MLANSIGSFFFLDDNTSNKACLDISRVMVRVSSSFKLVERLKVEIDGMDFWLTLKEDSWGPLRLSSTSSDKVQHQKQDSRLEASRLFPE